MPPEQPAFCPEYETITVPDITTFADNPNEIGKILLDFQGSFVILSRKSNFNSVLQLFKDIRNAATELVVESSQGDQFLTPWRTDRSVIRSKEIITDFSDINIALGPINKSSPSAKSQAIDLQKFWDVDLDHFETEDAHTFFASLASELRPVQSLTLTGVVPLALLIILALSLYGSIDELHYRRDQDTDTTQIF